MREPRWNTVDHHHFDTIRTRSGSIAWRFAEANSCAAFVGCSGGEFAIETIRHSSAIDEGRRLATVATARARHRCALKTCSLAGSDAAGLPCISANHSRPWGIA
jgi:hypothetical protein